MKKIFLGTLFLGLIGLGIIGCKKEEIGKNNVIDKLQENPLFQEKSSSNIPYYKDFDEVDMVIDILNEMDDDDRKSYELNHNYTSLFTTVYDVYQMVDSESIDDIADLERHVNSNSDMVAIISDENNELEYYPLYSDNPYSVVANANRLFVVGDMLIKVFENGLAASPINDSEKLRNLNKVYLSDKESNNILPIIFENEDNTKAACGSSYVEKQAYSSNGKYRVNMKLRVYKGANQISYNDWEGWKLKSRVESYGQVKGYHKVLGIWWNVKKQISGQIKYTAKFERFGSTHVLSRNEQFSYKAFNIKYGKNEKSVYSNSDYPATSIRFSNIDSWGKIPETVKVIEICN